MGGDRWLRVRKSVVQLVDGTLLDSALFGSPRDDLTRAPMESDRAPTALKTGVVRQGLSPTGADGKLLHPMGCEHSSTDSGSRDAALAGGADRAPNFRSIASGRSIASASGPKDAPQPQPPSPVQQPSMGVFPQHAIQRPSSAPAQTAAAKSPSPSPKKGKRRAGPRRPANVPAPRLPKSWSDLFASTAGTRAYSQTQQPEVAQVAQPQRAERPEPQRKMSTLPRFSCVLGEQAPAPLLLGPAIEGSVSAASSAGGRTLPRFSIADPGPGPQLQGAAAPGKTGATPPRGAAQPRARTPPGGSVTAHAATGHRGPGPAGTAGRPAGHQRAQTSGSLLSQTQAQAQAQAQAQPPRPKLGSAASAHSLGAHRQPAASAHAQPRPRVSGAATDHAAPIHRPWGAAATPPPRAEPPAVPRPTTPPPAPRAAVGTTPAPRSPPPRPHSSGGSSGYGVTAVPARAQQQHPATAAAGGHSRAAAASALRPEPHSAGLKPKAAATAGAPEPAGPARAAAAEPQPEQPRRRAAPRPKPASRMEESLPSYWLYWYRKG